MPSKRRKSTISKTQSRSISRSVGARGFNGRFATAARELQMISPGAPPLTTPKDSSLILMVLFKNVFLKGAINFIKEKREGRTVPADLGPGAPDRLWEVIVDGAEREVDDPFKPLGAISGHDVVFLIKDTFGLYNLRSETKVILECNLKRIWGFSHEDWHKASEGHKAFTITDVSYKDLLEIGTLAFGTDEQKRAMGFKEGY